jgi:fumarate reductase subunit C
VGLVSGSQPDAGRRRLKTFKWALTAFFLVLGLATLAAYMKIGYEHRDRVGERYTPAWVQPQEPAK